MWFASDHPVGKQIAHPTFSKTEHSIVRQISSLADNKKDLIHYMSWLFGILLTFTSLLPTLLIPLHNVLKEPFYLYALCVY